MRILFMFITLILFLNFLVTPFLLAFTNNSTIIFVVSFIIGFLWPSIFYTLFPILRKIDKNNENNKE